MATTTFHRKARCLSALALLGLLLAGFRDRAGSGPALIQPAGSGLHLKKVDGLSAEFGGSTWVAGAVSAKWPLGEGGHREDDISEVVLVPTADAAKRLPHFARYGVREIEIANEKEALARVFGPDDALRFSRREVKTLRAKGRFLIDRYEVGVECDWPWARARLVRAEVPGRHLRSGDADDGC
jgi:hypothetical protein